MVFTGIAEVPKKSRARKKLRDNKGEVKFEKSNTLKLLTICISFKKRN